MIRSRYQDVPPLARMTLALMLLSVFGLAGCGGAGDKSDSQVDPFTGAGNAPCSGQCADASSFLTSSEVETVIAQAVAEAQARNANATIAVVDRVGNVLGVYRMNGADTEILVDSGRGVDTGLEQIDVIPDTLAAISKAITGAYLSSEGNAFSTRTANQIVQEHFNPGELNQVGGPLFGVQFSQLACSDLNTEFNGAGVSTGPQRSPLGLSADPGGFPLYKDGTPVGGVGVIADGVYGLDLQLSDRDRDVDELIAFAASANFRAPVDRRAEHITVEGKVLRFSDARPDDLQTLPSQATPFASLTAADGSLVAVTSYFNGSILAGTAFGTANSGIAPGTGGIASRDGFVLVGNGGGNRYPAIAGTDGELQANEVTALLEAALDIANRSRAQIRQPLGDHARVSIAVVDSNGVVLGLVRSRDAPMFGTDVALQKARTATFFSSANAAGDLQSVPDAVYLGSGESVAIGDYVDAARDFLGSSTALADGAFAFADRSGGNLSRPYYPDGQVGPVHGPFSKPFDDWSPFSTGLQLDLVNNSIIQHVVHVLGGGPDVGNNCTGIASLPNGIQIFPGSVPIYRNGNLIGGIGVSGDGVEQDDMIAFLAVDTVAETLGTINNAPKDMRADRLAPLGIHLRYVQCPQAPFLDSNEAQVCEGK